MLFEILLSSALVGGGPVVGVPNPNEEALQALRELYTYSTQAVRVEPGEIQRMVGEIQNRLGEDDGRSSEALRTLVDAAEQPDPDGREIRVHARELYATLVGDQA